MIGLPTPLTFFCYEAFYPIVVNGPNFFALDKYTDKNLQHYMIMGLVAWLVTIGPDLGKFIRKDEKKNSKIK